MTIQCVCDPTEFEFAPVLRQAGLYSGIQRLLSFFEPFVKNIAVRIELLKAVTRIQVELECVSINQMNAAGRATRKNLITLLMRNGRVNGHGA